MRTYGICIEAITGLLILGIFSGVVLACGQSGGALVIADLVSEFPAVKMGGSTQIECIVADRYGEGFNYEWTATGGSISGTGTMVTWTAPDVYGAYSVTVTATDDNGIESSRELSINVTESG